MNIGLLKYHGQILGKLPSKGAVYSAWTCRETSRPQAVGHGRIPSQVSQSVSFKGATGLEESHSQIRTHSLGPRRTNHQPASTAFAFGTSTRLLLIFALHLGSDAPY